MTEANNLKPHPKVVTGVLPYNSQGEIFLIHSTKLSGEHWSLIGGHLEWSESIVDCAVREAIEETGFHLTRVEIIGFQEVIHPQEYYKPAHWVTMDVIGFTDERVPTLNNEADAYQWIAPTEALKLNLFKASRITVERFIAYEIKHRS